MLDNLKVIDASTVLAGPSVATYLAELGAEVIKVEHPIHPDVTRSWKLPEEDEASAVSAYFSSVNFNKEYTKLNLCEKEDYAEFMGLVDSADILIMNFKRSDYIKFNLDDTTLLSRNPRLIIGKINGYGEDSDRVAYDLILQAESGFMSINGQKDGPPTKMPVALIDVLSAHHLKEAILLALYEREKTNKGQSVSVSLYEAAISSLSNQASNYLMTDQIPERIGSLHPNIAPYGELFETSDEATITFAIGSDLHFEKLCGVLDLIELPDSDRFYSNQMRIVNREILQRLIEEKTIHLDSDPILKQLEELNVPAGKVKNLKEVFEDEKARGLILEEDIDGIKTRRIRSKIFKSNGN
ncbi:MAG: CoA transferase [Crocinitomicaceae bacterium]|nr:CoA transferase [Crocinitomicaceae bacterium]